MARSERRRRKNATLPEITLTPLIDTVLVLLIIFMISMPVLNTYFSVDLPQANNGESQNISEPVSVHVDADQRYYVNGYQHAYQNLPEQIRIALSNTSNTSVIIYADQNVSYGVVMSLLDDMKAIDAYVALAAEPRRT